MRAPACSLCQALRATLIVAFLSRPKRWARRGLALSHISAGHRQPRPPPSSRLRRRRRRRLRPPLRRRQAGADERRAPPRAAIRLSALSSAYSRRHRAAARDGDETATRASRAASARRRRPARRFDEGRATAPYFHDYFAAPKAKQPSPYSAAATTKNIFIAAGRRLRHAHTYRPSACAMDARDKTSISAHVLAEVICRRDVSASTPLRATPKAPVSFTSAYRAYRHASPIGISPFQRFTPHFCAPTAGHFQRLRALFARVTGRELR